MSPSHAQNSAAAEQPYAAVLAATHHGTHLCAFYETEEDLLELVGQFCAAGARRGDLCLWVIPDGVDAAALAIPDVEIHSASHVYQQGGPFESGPVVALWHTKLGQALAQNHTGLCATGDTRWLQQRDWQAFMEYENYLNEVIAGKSISILCTYPLSACKAGDILDVVRAHEVALAKQKKRWSVLETHLTDDSPDALEAASRIASLTPREREVLLRVADGTTTKSIAFELGLSVRTIEVHRERAIKRLGVRTMIEAVRLLTLASPSAPLVQVRRTEPLQLA
jgi:DNA-binding CsgD family transcriptional regulator